MALTRRAFLASATTAGAGLLLGADPAWAAQSAPAAPGLASRFPDLPRHFIFEYYPWYGVSPWRHWDASGRQPPVDIASNYIPALGPYDSASIPVLEQHARWIRASGAGAINVSWWGRGSDTDRVVPLLMDVMAAHDLHVTFHIEPYARGRADRFSSDIQYLIEEYGERRRWDCFLLLANADGRVGPIFKTFSTIETSEHTDCHGTVFPNVDWVRDSTWRRETDLVRARFAREFDHVTLLADSSAADRVLAAGFDGMALYDNFVTPDTWPVHARNFSGANLLFSFNVNAGFDGLLERDPRDDCYRPPEFEPGRVAYDWTRTEQRDAARAVTDARIAESLARTVTLQSDPDLANARRGFFAAFINSFNEWHEGTQFEPMRPRGGLTREELAIGYHNHDDGAHRLETLRALLEGVLGAAP